MEDKIYFLISIQRGFREKFISFLHNLNTLNEDENSPVKIESIYTEKKIAVIPKQEESLDGS